jgi:Tol biopolymer transport system component
MTILFEPLRHHRCPWRIITLIVIATVVLSGCSAATKPRDLRSVPLESSVLYLQNGALRTQTLNDGAARVLATSVRAGCAPYAIAPDGSRVAYQDQNGVWWAISTAGGTPVQISDKPVQMVAWLPSSQGVYFSDGADIRALLFDQTRSSAVLPGGGQRFVSPTWAPNGEHIALIENPRANVAEVKLAKADGSGMRSLGRVLLSPTEATELCPPQIIWSPDSTRFLFNPGRSATIFYLTGGTPLPLPAHGADAVYAWAPDGSQVAFTDGQGTLWLVSSGGTGVRNVADAVAGPAWSPDGKQVAYISQDKGGYALRTYDLSRSSTRLLVQVPNDALLNPQWFPAAEALLFTRQARDGNSTIWTVPASGSGSVQQIASGAAATLFQKPK